MSHPEHPPAFWRQALAPFAKPAAGRSVLQLLNTFLPFAALWALMYLSVGQGWSYGITLALALPAALFLVRLFIIQHDCGHGSFLPSRRACSAIGSVIGVLTLTPYHYWRQEHAVHHATSGRLDKRGTGDIDTLTVAEYEALPARKRLAYRLYRHPLVLFGIGPLFQFLVRHRFPWNALPRSRAGWTSLWLTNAALAAVVLALAVTTDFDRFLLVQVPITALSCWIGVWLFYVQHQFGDTYWRRGREWNYHDAALLGCSHYDLGPVLNWLTGNIGLHHIHHLSSRIPNYRLPACQRAIPELSRATRLTLLGSLQCMTLALWDESREKLVSLREFRRSRRATARNPEAPAER